MADVSFFIDGGAVTVSRFPSPSLAPGSRSLLPFVWAIISITMSSPIIDKDAFFRRAKLLYQAFRVSFNCHFNLYRLILISH